MKSQVFKILESMGAIGVALEETEGGAALTFTYKGDKVSIEALKDNNEAGYIEFNGVNEYGKLYGRK